VKAPIVWRSRRPRRPPPRLEAHRLTTIRACDRIHVLDNGQIVESGTHDDLIRAGGHFAALYNADQQDDTTQQGKAPHAA